MNVLSLNTEKKNVITLIQIISKLPIKIKKQSTNKYNIPQFGN